MYYLVYADGACENNGRTDACIEGSFAVYEFEEEQVIDHSSLFGKPPLYHAQRHRLVPFEGKVPTNNMAEALTLHMALSWACENNVLRPDNLVHIFMDSELVLRQFTGSYVTRNATLFRIYRKIYDMLADYSRKIGDNVEKFIRLDWVSGEIMKKSVIGH